MRDEIARAQRAVRDAEMVLVEREQAVEKARREFEIVNQRLDNLKREKDTLLRQVYVVDEGDLRRSRAPRTPTSSKSTRDPADATGSCSHSRADLLLQGRTRGR